MLKFRFLFLIAVSPIFTGGIASACMTQAPIDLHDVEYADVVIVGTVANYQIVRDPTAREFHKKLMAKMKDPPESLKNVSGFMSDYARFDIVVDHALTGAAPKTVAVTWDNSTFGEPDHLPSGLLLFALRKSHSKIPPLRGPSATVLPNREPNLLTLLQAPCARPFMFENSSEQALRVRQILASSAK